MCQTQELTKSQALLQNVQFDVIIKDQIQAIENSGFEPVEINVNKIVYEKMKSQFCQEKGISCPGEIELSKYAGLPIRVQSNDGNFNNSSFAGWVFPIQVTMKMKEEAKIVYNLDEASNEEESAK